jgi:hypothetical protein
MNSLEGSIHSIVRIFASAVGKVIGVDSRSSGLERIAVASLLMPILTTSVLWYT